MSFYGNWPPHVSMAQQRSQAKRRSVTLRKKRPDISPVAMQGRKITRTFWGDAWCKNLESYQDFAYRLERGRSYVRNGLVLHLGIQPGEIEALVSGSSLYTVRIAILPIKKGRWSSICSDSVGGIDSLVELLQGRISTAVMDRICRQRTGLFPSPPEIDFSCSCPDNASVCKHVAAALYGVGVRLDEQPELVFRLRKVDAQDLIANADVGTQLTRSSPAKERILTSANLSEMFGVEIGSAAKNAVKTPANKGTKKLPKKTVKKPRGKSVASRHAEPPIPQSRARQGGTHHP